MSLPEPITVSRAAQLIAAEIREKGHYQGQNTLADGSREGACLVSNMVWPAMHPDVQVAYINEIVDRAKMTTAMPEAVGVLRGPRFRAVKWNDAAPTEQVLEVLDAIAAPAVVEARA